MPSEATTALSRYIDGDYIAKNPGWHEEDAAWKCSYILNIMSRNGLLPLSMCEIGCGSGEIVRLLSTHFPNTAITGFEIAPVAFEMCEAKATDTLSFVNGSPFGTGLHYEVGMAIDVIEHVENPFDFLRNMRKLADYHIFHIPLDMNALTVARGWSLMEARQHIGHLHYFTADTVLALLQETGFSVIDRFYTPWAIDQAGKTWKKRLAALPRRFFFKYYPDLTVRLVGGWSLLVFAKSN